MRDDLGRVTQRTETQGAGPAAVYGYQYNAAGQLTGVTLNGASSETYAYDVTGGLTSRGSGLVSSWISTDGHGRPTHTADGTELTWSPDGELLSQTAPGGAITQFAYDGFGRLIQVTLPNGQVGRYRYDAMGRRTAVRLGGSLVRRFVYGGAEFPRARIDAAGDVLERYEYASYAHVPDLIVRRDGQRLRLITDTLGSVRAVVDADTGAVIQRLSYDAYGRTTQDTAPGTQPFGFKGALTDPVAQGAGLIWMGIRAYLPSLGRFTTPDPAGLSAGWNQHDALAGEPVNVIDADGRVGVRLVPVPMPWPSGPTDPESNSDSGLSSAIDQAASWLGGLRRHFSSRLIQLQRTCIDAINGINNAIDDALGGADDVPTRNNTPSPALSDSPYSPGNTSRRQSDNRRSEGSPNLDPDSPIPDRKPGTSGPGKGSQRTPHAPGQRNQGAGEEHSRTPKGAPNFGNPRR